MKKEDSRSEAGLRDEQGMMVVEAVLSFTVFIMVVLAIILLINVFLVHNRVQYAINEAANEIAAYSYLYQGLGVRKADGSIHTDGGKVIAPIETTTSDVISTIEKIQTLTGTIENAGESEDISQTVQDVYTQFNDTKDGVEASVVDIKKLVENPKHTVAGIIYTVAFLGEDALKKQAGQALASVFTKKYLETEKASADEYLKGFGVKDGYAGLDFSGSGLFRDDKMRMIDIVVSYQIDLDFLKFVLPEPKIKVVQRVTIPAWLGGDDLGLEKYGIKRGKG